MKFEKSNGRLGYYQLHFKDETKTYFGEEGKIDGNSPCIISHNYYLTTNNGAIPKEKFQAIEEAIYKILNDVA